MIYNELQYSEHAARFVCRCVCVNGSYCIAVYLVHRLRNQIFVMKLEQTKNQLEMEKKNENVPDQFEYDAHMQYNTLRFAPTHSLFYFRL